MLWKLASCENYGNFNLSPQDSNPMASDEGGVIYSLKPSHQDSNPMISDEAQPIFSYHYRQCHPLSHRHCLRYHYRQCHPLSHACTRHSQL
jgi:hypothetical protein